MAAKSKAAPAAKKTPAKKAPKTKSRPKPKSDASKAADRKALAVEQVHAYTVRDPEHSAIVLEVDGTQHTLNEQTLLNLRREINELAAGFVH